MESPQEVLPEARQSPPSVVAVLQGKGGTGKSVTAIGMAAVTADTNGTAYLVDVDPQSTTREVADRAERSGTPLPFHYEADTNPAHLAQLRKVRGVDMIFVDTPGNLDQQSGVLRKVLEAADFGLIPYVHDPFVVSPTQETAALCAAYGVPCGVFINRVDGSRIPHLQQYIDGLLAEAPGLLGDAQAVLDKLGLPRFKSFIREYAAHSQTHVEGLMITAYRGDPNAGKASEDMRRLHGELLLHLGRNGS